MSVAPTPSSCSSCSSSGPARLQVQQLLQRHNLVLVERSKQDEGNSPPSFEALHRSLDATRAERVRKRLIEIEAKNGDEIYIERKNVEVSIDKIKRVLQQMNMSVNLEDLRIRNAVADLTELVRKVLGRELRKVSWNADRTALLATYNHHAILLGNGNVVHFTTELGDLGGEEGGQASVYEHLFSNFLDKSEPEWIHVKPYDLGFPRVASAALAREMVAAVTKDGLQEQYCLRSNNCEHLATSLRCGEHRSQQIERLNETFDIGGRYSQTTGQLAQRSWNWTKEHPNLTVITGGCAIAAMIIGHFVKRHKENKQAAQNNRN